MKRLPKLLFLLAGFFWFSSTTIKAQNFTNLSLSFDGVDDYVTLNPIPSALSGNSNFTYESWFTITSPATTCISNFRRLFAISGKGSPTSRFEVGECNSQLKLFWRNTAGNNIPNGVTTISGPLALGWHHLAVVRNGTNLDFYLDGVTIPFFSGALAGTLNTSIFVAGHWADGPTPMQDWHGEMDEIRLWDIARTITQIQEFKDCSLGGTPPNLVVNWTFDQTASAPPVSPGGNNAGAGAEDMSGNGNHGTLNNFTLNGSNSNFIGNNCPPIFTLDITDLGSQTASLIDICSGIGAHFCIVQNGIAPQGLSGATVDWEYYDVGSNNPWLPITSTQFPSSLCFGVQTIDISTICMTSTTGYVDRKYRAKVTKGSPTQSCTYLTSERLLRIHCPVTDATISFAPPIPNPPNVALCEGTTYTTTVTLNSTDNFIPSGLPTIGDLSIQWCIDGLPVLPTNVASLPFTGIATAPELCFEAKVANGVCPLVTARTCIPVDKVPMCGIIDAKPEPPVLMSDPNGGQYDYLLCPGNDVELMMLTPTDFKDCNAVWQFMFPSVSPPVWNDLNGSGNPTQNTNILPEISPPNPPWFTNWPPLETCILYRIECRPLHYPLSDCVPCHSNVVQICLKTAKPDPVISAVQNPICKGGSSVISVTPYDPACNYDWYCDGLLVGNGPSINATQQSCYWVVVADDCFIQTSNPLNLQVCEIVPIIECPMVNPCACLGVPITLIGCNSYNTCGSTGPLPLIYSWSSDTNPNTGTSCQFVDTPDPNGTTYTLLVTDPNISNCGPYATSIFIKPCL